MNKIILISFITSIIGIFIGYYFKLENEMLGNRIIGISVIIFVILFMPLFIYNSWKGKKLSDYTFSDENIKKMKSKSSKSIR
jgi:ABC-type Mn2+/Zn2+ transport system permease subunit|tara:strand:+ start:419 stop:664 length:246 start_codon:yes stop_codon:yes gene_type:complete